MISKSRVLKSFSTVYMNVIRALLNIYDYARGYLKASSGLPTLAP